MPRLGPEGLVVRANRDLAGQLVRGRHRARLELGAAGGALEVVPSRRVVVPIAVILHVMIALVARNGSVWVIDALCLGVLLIAGRLMDAA
jgi:hypothetical protein